MRRCCDILLFVFIFVYLFLLQGVLMSSGRPKALRRSVASQVSLLLSLFTTESLYY
jgi:preprotein translocase subunit SecG